MISTVVPNFAQRTEERFILINTSNMEFNAGIAVAEMLMSTLLLIIIVASNPQTNNNIKEIPIKWNCSTAINGSRVVNVECYIHRQLQWNMAEFRNWSREIGNVSVSLALRCYAEGSISLRYPVRAKNLVSLEIDNCDIHHYFDLESSDSITSEVNQLKTLILGNVTLHHKSSEILEHLKRIRKGDTMICTPHVEIEVFIINIKRYKYIPDININLQNAARELNLYQPFCVYRNMQYLEISHNAKEMAEVLINDFLRSSQKQYPVLKTVSLNSNGLHKIPEIFNEWWKKFKNLTEINLSHNHIQHIFFPQWNVTGTPSKVIINLNHNNVTDIDEKTLDVIKDRKHRLITLQGNPFNCHCNLTKFATFIKSSSIVRNYYRNLSCSQPPALRGQRIQDVSQQALCKNDSISLHRDSENTVLYRNMAVIMATVTVVIIVVIVCLLFRKELRIVTYSKLPMLYQITKDDVTKSYDVFISYSSQDEEWVHKQLYKHLQSRNFKVCLHHKDFVPGAWISENIINSIENSRHTIMVLSPNFLKSEWCLLEFRKAFHQTLVEKNGHLIVVLLKSVEMDYLEKDMKHFLQTHTYLKTNESLFWDKMYNALSDKGRHILSSGRKIEN